MKTCYEKSKATILNPLLRNVVKWSDTLSKSHLKCAGPF